MNAEVLPAGDATADRELEAFFAACPTSVAQQTTAWRDVITRLDHDEPVFLGCRSAGRLVGVLPAYRFEGPLGAILLSVPQCGPLGGVAALPGVDTRATYHALVGEFLAVAAARGCALATIVTSPFWSDRARYEEERRPDYVLENVCQVLDLAAGLDVDGLPPAASPHVRRHLRKALASGFVVDDEQSAANLETWYAIHAARHAAIGASPLPRALFEAALEVMVPSGQARFLFVRRADSGELVAGGFYVHHQAVVDAMMAAARSDAVRLGANYLVGAHSIRWAASRGLRYYNWEASPPEGGVHRFKMQWGSRDVPYAFLTWVTGDARPFIESTPAVVRAGYPGHYVLPFDRIGAPMGGHGGGVASSRANAWRTDREASDPVRAVLAHYEGQLRRFGPTAQGMDWKDEASQRLRFTLLTGVCELRGKRVHEVGCGAGHLLDLLRARGIACDYSGSDASPAMLAAARARHPDVVFTLADVGRPLRNGPWDVVVGSGLFHVKLDAEEATWQAFVEMGIRHMWEAAREAIAFNLMSDQVDYRSAQLWYPPVEEMVAFCRTLSPWVVLRTDYPLHECTVYVHRRRPAERGS